MADYKWRALAAFACGATIGVVAGLFLAPKSGEQLRADLRHRLNNGADRVRAVSSSVARRAQEMANEVHHGVSEIAEAGLRASRKVMHS